MVDGPEAGADDALHNAGVVPEVDEGQLLAVLAAMGDPAAERHLAIDVGRRQRSATIAAQRRR